MIPVSNAYKVISKFRKGALSELRWCGAAVGQTRTRTTSTILWCGLPSAVFGPNHHEQRARTRNTNSERRDNGFSLI